MKRPQRVTTKIKIAYALPAFAMAVVGIPIYIYIPKFYTDVIGLDIALIGAILLGLRVFDALTDPLMGLISDRTNTPYGRRRPFIVIGALLLAVSLLFLFNPPAMSIFKTTAWFSVWISGVFIFWTVTVVPYESLGPELTSDYDERTVLFGIRDGSLIFGTMAAATIPVLIRALLAKSSNPYTDNTVFLIMSLIYVPLILVCCFICIVLVRETERVKISAPWHLLQTLKTSLYNKPFVILILAFAFSSIAAQMPAALILYYVEYVLLSSRAELFLLVYFISGIAFLPFWVKLSKSIGKKITWIVSMVINTGAFFFVFWLGAGDEIYFGILVFLSGIGFGAGLVLPSSLTADVIDYDHLQSGKRQEGLYIGIFSVTKKLAGAVGAGTGLWILGVSGYRPNNPQTPEVILALRSLYALIPCFLSIFSLIIAGFYPLSKARHEQILSVIEESGEKI